MNFGGKIRQIRKQKGLTQKDVYQNILSKSYAIEFEKGNHSISATLLLEVLDRLSMEIDEFLYISDNYHLNSYSDYIYRYSKYANRHDLAALKKLLAEVLLKQDTIDQVRAAEVRCRIAVIEHLEQTGIYDPAVVSSKDKSLIQQRLETIESWTLQEVQLYGNTVEFMDAEHQVRFFRRLSKSLEQYLPYDRGREIFCSMLVNLISLTLRGERLDYAEVLIKQLQLISTDYKELFHRLAGKFFEGVLAIKQDKETEGRKKTRYVLDVLHEVGHSALAQELEIFL
ncbi:transcriptional activator, Rgg/GadR/MutR family,C-terminal domain-containing protein [Listeria floridensis FSL S10-1187]|uniref:Transcriptional activator, Rgg/GadR/MutR family,C-terminal domain-containing protein n=1 Tax=Listeria floridensis FSL S10-1187 TaxID=1265817 RepID=A0ABP3B199_9LIST|nr:Rgg/GadR/MutR family transcriptional regulator [Listeria floridensis]EUJ33695.1 transcriptional activator, Rgg/GadR/MutR family,C-terminal domain-containing protein [Listeria floridensis FSL S10-1187]